MTDRSPSQVAASQAENYDRLVGLLLELRAEAQYLLKGVEEIQAEPASGQPDKLVEFAKERFERNQKRIAELFKLLRGEFAVNQAAYKWCADEVANIENAWEEVGSHWRRFLDDKDPLDLTLDYVTKNLGRMIFGCGKLTIPGRVVEHLQTMRHGHAFKFHSAFKDEVSSEEERVKILQNIADHPKEVPGMVDVTSGLIYRASSKYWRRILSILLVLLLAAVGFAALPPIHGFVADLSLSETASASEPTGREIRLFYFFVLLGAALHFAVGAIKQSREESDAGVRALNDWVLWINIREWSLMQTVLYLWVALIFLLVTLDKVEWSTALFAGYSIDNLVDVFLERFTTWAEAGAGALKERL